jgi:hypothetical protein
MFSSGVVRLALDEALDAKHYDFLINGTQPAAKKGS